MGCMDETVSGFSKHDLKLTRWETSHFLVELFHSRGKRSKIESKKKDTVGFLSHSG
jgi:hypothetical protein